MGCICNHFHFEGIQASTSSSAVPIADYSVMKKTCTHRVFSYLQYWVARIVVACISAQPARKRLSSRRRDSNLAPPDSRSKLGTSRFSVRGPAQGDGVCWAGNPSKLCPSERAAWVCRNRNGMIVRHCYVVLFAAVCGCSRLINLE